jgi:hypothetical protein
MDNEYKPRLTFEEIAKMPVLEIPDPPQLPYGTYLFGIVGIPTIREANTGNKAWVLSLCPYQPRDDVDRAELEKVLAASGSKLPDIRIEDAWYVTDKNKHMFRDFLVNIMGCTTGTVQQCVAELAGKQYLATLGPEMFNGVLRAKIIRRAKVE